MQIEATWWISAVEAPIVAALFYMLHGLRRDMQERIDRSDQRENEVVGRARDELAEFKLEVARSYVPLSLIRDVDRRLSQQLLRIEEKIEEVKRLGAPPLRVRDRTHADGDAP
ncbi:hypothetical protein GCM10011504_07780 [Siccirubricoccus deserti]|uniref:Uncharacterized protein n=1 Tax=Siccirubricoccus deserti TaxID=2013562 RepID=A0A9X0UBW5_9PROT|nr:hypothetical protein [Siccirubricoccus deserti]MBC4014547.1 hypothetical protein [Siccirubricoccus deserti]GGC32024.1 hypothetical protein GCM10011504_07780 [Siccirubricoccus deserti]